MSTTTDISAVLADSVLRVDSAVAWGDMVYDSVEETLQRKANAIVDEIAELDSEQRYEEQMVEYLASNPAMNDSNLFTLVIKAVFARNLITKPFDPYDFPTEEEEILDGWEVPNITERKALWRNFPVVVKAHRLNCADGKDRYTVSWHADNLAAWRSDRSECWDEYQDYETWVLTRMEHAFAKYSHIYTLEDKPEGDILYYIAVDAEEHEEPARRALDVLRAAGVNWKRDGANHDVVVPRSMTEEAKAALLASLRACSDCVVTEHAGFLCRVVIGEATAVPVAAPVTETPINVLKRFPVTWDRNGAIHDVKIHFGKCPRKDIPSMVSNLLAALRACSGCEVTTYPVGDAYVCRVIVH